MVWPSFGFIRISRIHIPKLKRCLSFQFPPDGSKFKVRYQDRGAARLNRGFEATNSENIAAPCQNPRRFEAALHPILVINITQCPAPGFEDSE
jgi:hypothetical protein